jgi:hypothetical protein
VKPQEATTAKDDKVATPSAAAAPTDAAKPN